MLSVFQVPVVSGFHAIEQAAPGLKICPGLGSVGVTSAKATNARDKTTAEKALRENIETDFAAFVGKQRKTRRGGNRKVERER
jgi:hypothetical protein